MVTTNDLSPDISRARSLWPAAALLGALFFVLFFPVLMEMAREWLFDASSRHGLVALVLTAFLVWRSRSELVKIEARPSLWGWLIMSAALIQLLAGYFGGDFLIMRLSVWISLVGLILAMLGWPFIKALAFPLFVLLWTIRVPLMISTKYTVALEELAELITVTFLKQVAGMALYRDGDSFEISGARLAGVDLFSAMRLATSVCFFALAYAYFADKRIWTRLGLPILSLISFVISVSLAGIVILWVSDRNLEVGNWIQEHLNQWIPAFLALGCTIAVHRLCLLRKQAMERA